MDRDGKNLQDSPDQFSISHHGLVTPSQYSLSVYQSTGFDCPNIEGKFTVWARVR